jgi:hypothetical protein
VNLHSPGSAPLDPGQVADTVQHPPCSACGQADDHPRHLIVRVMDVRTIAPPGADDAAIEALDRAYNPNSHLDCCTCHELPGFADESCRDLHERHGRKKGAELRKALARSPRKLAENERTGRADAVLPTPEVR